MNFREYLNESKSEDIIDVYMKMTAPKLKKIINDAVKEYNIDSSWNAPKTNNKEELIDHINELCNENSLQPDKNGVLKK